MSTTPYKATQHSQADLSYLSDAERDRMAQELAKPAKMMAVSITELSPAAKDVDDALAACIQLQGEIIRARPLAAAALRAAADLVMPETGPLPPAGDNSAGHYCHGWRDCQSNARRDILAIAAELENSQ